jgi:hypothetical protein
MKRVSDAPGPSARQFVYATLVNGGRFTQIQQIFALCNIQVPTESQFYRQQSAVCEVIVRIARESCALARDAMEGPVIIAMDGSWSQRRNAAHCVVDFINAHTGKIVDFEIIEKDVGFFHGNYHGPSNGMEVEGVRRLIRRWKDDPKVVAFCHDRDAKTARIIRELWGIAEFLDKNHVTKCFDRRIEKISLLSGLKTKLRKFFKVILKLDDGIDQKKAYWANALQHYQGNHNHCLPHVKKKHVVLTDRRVISALSAFLNDTLDLIAKVRPGVSTQMCESFHSLKGKLASKDIAWAASWKARVACAVLDVNCRGWRLELYDRLSLPPLSPEARAVVEEHEAELLEDMARRNIPSEKRKALLYRAARRHYVSSVEATGTGYKPLAGNRKAVCTHEALEEALESMIDPEPAGPLEDPNYEYIDPDDEHEEEVVPEMEVNPRDDEAVFEAILGAGECTEQEPEDEDDLVSVLPEDADPDMRYVLPPNAVFEIHDDLLDLLDLLGDDTDQ